MKATWKPVHYMRVPAKLRRFSVESGRTHLRDAGTRRGWVFCVQENDKSLAYVYRPGTLSFMQCRFPSFAAAWAYCEYWWFGQGKAVQA